MNGKRLVFAIILIAILLAGCRPSDATCESAMEQMTKSKWEKLDAFQVQMILNNTWPPDTVGEVLQKCILGGWDGYQ